MRKIDEFNFFRELFFALKRDGVEEYNIMELGEQLYPYFAFGDYGKMFKVKTNDLFKRVDVSSIFESIYKESTEVKRIFEKAYETAYKKTDRQTYQAMEAFVHNLNTMHSRAGAQVPFSSINFGTDTSPEGRMVIKNFLLSVDAGLG